MTQTPESERLDAEEIVAQTAAFARHLRDSGVSFLPNPDDEGVNKWAPQMESAVAQQPPADVAGPVSVQKPKPETSATPEPQATRPAAPKTKTAATVISGVAQPYPGDSLDADQRISQLEVLQQQVAQCTRCDQLAECRKMTVFGEGSVTPRVAFFGEGPGADEDRTGRPFVGKAGQLLTKMIEACKMQREDVYILNTVKCRPPGNRNPEQEEVSNCREYFEQQLATLRPEYIVCLGAVASQSLLNSKLSVGRLRGTLHPYFDSKVLVTYHPAYLLRNPSAKKAAWQDLQLMLRDAGLL